MEDTELVEGLVLDQKASHLAGGITRVEKAKIGLIQFCISPPKTDVHMYIMQGCICVFMCENVYDTLLCKQVCG